MKVEQFAPSPALAGFIRVFEVVETDEAMTRTLLPETGIIVGFRYSGSSTLLEGSSTRLVPNSVVTGLRSSVRRMHTSARSGILLAKFRDSGAAPFFAEPLHHLFGSTVALEDLLERSLVEDASARMGDATSHAERIAIFEQFLLARRRSWTPDPVVVSALRTIHATPASIRIGALARDLRLSHDALEKRFRRAVGTSPKRFASLVRLRRALSLHHSSATLTQLSGEAGYYDQSHFIRELRSVTGAAPARFFGSAEYC